MYKIAFPANRVCIENGGDQCENKEEIAKSIATILLNDQMKYHWCSIGTLKDNYIEKIGELQGKKINNSELNPYFYTVAAYLAWYDDDVIGARYIIDKFDWNNEVEINIYGLASLIYRKEIQDSKKALDYDEYSVNIVIKILDSIKQRKSDKWCQNNWPDLASSSKACDKHFDDLISRYSYAEASYKSRVANLTISAEDKISKSKYERANEYARLSLEFVDKNIHVACYIQESYPQYLGNYGFVLMSVSKKDRFMKDDEKLINYDIAESFFQKAKEKLDVDGKCPKPLNPKKDPDKILIKMKDIQDELEKKQNIEQVDEHIRLLNIYRGDIKKS